MADHDGTPLWKHQFSAAEWQLVTIVWCQQTGRGMRDWGYAYGKWSVHLTPEAIARLDDEVKRAILQPRGAPRVRPAEKPWWEKWVCCK